MIFLVQKSLREGFDHHDFLVFRNEERFFKVLLGIFGESGHKNQLVQNPDPLSEMASIEEALTGLDRC